jgi:hypothetical protein
VTLNGYENKEEKGQEQGQGQGQGQGKEQEQEKEKKSEADLILPVFRVPKLSLFILSSSVYN